MNGNSKNPIQPLVIDEQKVLRFKQNKIVRDLLDFASSRGMSLNEIAFNRTYSDDDHQQFAQLIGYSVSGYGELPYVDNVSFAAVAYMEHNPMTSDVVRIMAMEDKIDEVKKLIAEGIGWLDGLIRTTTTNNSHS